MPLSSENRRNELTIDGFVQRRLHFADDSIESARAQREWKRWLSDGSSRAVPPSVRTAACWKANRMRWKTNQSGSRSAKAATVV